MQEPMMGTVAEPVVGEEEDGARGARGAREQLVGLVGGRFGGIPAELLADHVLGLDPRADAEVLREAIEALRRRFAFAERDGLRVARRPEGGLLGEYATRGSGRGGRARPYRTLLESIEPIRGSCACADFRRGSLGLCKHLLVVLDELARKPRLWQRALRETAAPARPRLVWSPARPLLGPDDWLERVRFDPAGKPASRLPRVARRFAQGVGAERVLRSTHAGDPRKRLALVRELGVAAKAGDPALAARLREEADELARVVRLAGRERRLREALSGLSRKLYPYQREGVRRFLERGRLLLADDMGLGKTVQAIASGHALFHAGLVKRGLLVVPAPLKHQWLREWRATSDAPAELVEGSREERARIYQATRRGFLIANYEQLLRDLDLIQAWAPELGVLDEAQRIKNWAAKTSHAVKSLRPEYRLVLTGTPLENRLEELASIVEWVDDHALEPKWRLAPLHALREGGAGPAVGARHLDTLRARLAPCTVRRVRHEVLDQLPERTDTTIEIEMTPAQREVHAEYDRPIASLLKRAERRPLTQEEFLRLMQLLLRQRQACNGLALADFEEVWPAISGRAPTARLLASLDSPKLAELRALVESLAVDQERRVVVFSQWRRMLELAAWSVSDLLESSGSRAVFFTGRENARRRAANLVDFHDDPRTRILFASDAGGVGLNLQRAASACVLLELPWNPAVLEQRVGRVHRLGQTEPVQAYSLVARGGIEERIASIVADKRALFRGLFDGGSDEILFDRSGSFLDSLRRATEAAEPARGNGAAASLEERDEDDPDDDRGERLELAPMPPSEAAADGAAEQAARGTEAGAPGAPLASPLGELLAGVSIQRTPDGGLRLEAPPESASGLVELFEQLAAALRRGSGPAGR